MALPPVRRAGPVGKSIPFLPIGIDRLSSRMRSGNQAAIRLVVSTMWGLNGWLGLPSAQAPKPADGSALWARSQFRLSGGVMLHSLSVAPDALSNRLPRACIVMPAALASRAIRKTKRSLLPWAESVNL